MTPKEKAEDLFQKMFCSSKSIKVEQSKKCALIAVTEIIKEHYPQDAKRCEYWSQVKTEIQKI